MKYLFTNIIGSFVLNSNFKIIDKILFKNIQDYQNKEKTEKRLLQNHKKLSPVPKKEYTQILALFKDKKYYSEFYQKNIQLTKAKIKTSVNEDQLIIQTISNIKELGRTHNLFSKRLREWYSLYNPELSEEITSHEKFVEQLSTKKKAKTSIGANLENIHLEEIFALAKETKRLLQLKEQHGKYLEKVMKKYCPNLQFLAGTTIGAELIELGKSLKHLAMLPASTIQLLGAEKALFRHMKTGSRSPKYGVIFAHQLIQKSKKSDRGKMARMLADKISLCTRLDYFKGEFKAKEYKKELEGKLK